MGLTEDTMSGKVAYKVHKVFPLQAFVATFKSLMITAIDQIKHKEYPAKLAEYTGEILLVGINYDKETKLHTCKIERMG